MRRKVEWVICYGVGRSGSMVRSAANPFVDDELAARPYGNMTFRLPDGHLAGWRIFPL
ncbi:hypothetical protein DESC_830054 [Desulfosarcina cetonica]|nr:hypothetical protein DESC_830054 [Desulfosarcina cetonica]